MNAPLPIPLYLAEAAKEAGRVSRPSTPVANPATLADLTSREREVLTLVGGGLSNDEIAVRLFLSPLAAKTHVSRTMSKVGAAGSRPAGGPRL